MELVLLGTGASDGWPNPWCSCASCDAVRALGVLRGQSSLLVDGTLLIDCGPEAPRAAVRHGVDLTAVTHLLFTHAHPDHFATAPLMWHAWAQGARPLEVIGPPAVIAACRADDEADPSTTYRQVCAGDRVTAGGYDVRVLAANHNAATGPPVLFDVTGPRGERLFYGSDTGPLPAATVEAMRGRSYDVLLLEETSGTGPAAPGHHNLELFVNTVAALRDAGAVTPQTRVVATHLGHGNPPPPELDRRLAAVGAEALPDGSVVRVG